MATKSASQANIEASALALATIERLGGDSPAHFLCSDPHLLRWFCTSFLPTHPLVSVLADAITDPAATETALGEIAKVAWDDKPRTREMARVGAVEAVIDAMTRHAANAEVAQSGCWALRKFACMSAADDPLMDRRLREAGAIEAIVAAMKAHSAASAGVAEWAPCALVNIAANAESRVHAVQCGAVELVLVGMRAHADSADVQQECCSALANMSANNADTPRRVAEAGAITSILSTMERHRGDVELLESAGRALAHILSTPSMHRGFMTQAISDALRKAVEDNPLSIQLKLSFNAITRSEADAARQAAEQRVCTRVMSPLCKDPCNAREGCLCIRCAIVQTLFICVTCSSSCSNTRICKPCMTLHHAGHLSIETVRPGTCDCPCTTTAEK